MSKARNLANLLADGVISADELAEGAALPSQTGQSGKYLSTDGSSASWAALSVVKISGVTYPGDDTAALPAGGQTLTITGSGFSATPIVYVGGTLAPSVTFVSSTQITFTSPAKSAGTYDVYVVNPDGATAISVFGVSYSGVPTWTTAAGSLGSVDSTFSIQLIATSDSSVTYSLSSGSTLPAGVTLSSSGLLSGTLEQEQTFNFSVDAIDAENQDTPRSFSVTISLADPNFNLTTLLLNGDGTNAAQNNTFLDSSTNNFTITRNGNTTQGSFSPFSVDEGKWSNYFDGDSDFLALPVTVFDNPPTTFTLEVWAYPLALKNQAGSFHENIIFSKGATYLSFGITSEGYIQLYYYDGSARYITGSGGTVTVNEWNHIALSVSSGSATVFLNGGIVGTGTWFGMAGGHINTTAYIGGSSDANGLTTRWFQGYLSGFKISLNEATYTSAFTPSITSAISNANTFLLTCQSNRFVDNSTNNLAITVNGNTSVQPFSPFAPSAVYSAATKGGSGYFDGSGDYLSIASSASLNFQSSSWTAECYVYFTGTAQYQTVASFYNPSNNAYQSILTFDTTNKAFGIGFVNSSGTAVTLNYTVAIPFAFNQWMHVATVFTGTQYIVFCNGVEAGRTTAAVTMWDGNLSIGNLSPNFNGSPVQQFQGYIQSLRLIKGTALYTSAFTPPTAPLTAITNTSLLLNFTNAGIVDATAKNVIETVGNAQISTSVVKYGTGSLAFDGTGDWLLAANSPNLNFGAGDFTIEYWFYPTQNRGVSGHFAKRSSGGSVGILNYIDGTNLIPSFFFATQAGSFTGGISGASPTSAFTLNQWTHYAVTRQGSTFRIFMNGVAEYTSGAITGAQYDDGSPFVIGAYGANGDGPIAAGYIDDLRITKGLARYTSNFTPPESSFKLK